MSFYLNLRCPQYSGLKIGLSTLMKLFMFLVMLHAANGKKQKKKIPKVENELENFDADVFCKAQSRLIKIDRPDEIMIVDSGINNSVLLECKYCDERGRGYPKIWSRQKHIFSGNITEVKTSMSNNATLSSAFITKDHSLVLRNLQESDMGLYFCRAPFVGSTEKCFNYLIDLCNETGHEISGKMNEFKNYTNYFITDINEYLVNRTFEINDVVIKLKVFTEWSEWSECDSCYRKEGIRYRTGKCRVKPFCEDMKFCMKHRVNLTASYINEDHNTEKPSTIEGEVADPSLVEENLVDFGLSLSCRSLLLLKLTPVLYNLTAGIPDFILNDKCNAPCSGRAQKKGPRYKKSIVLATGAHLTLVCPDSTIDSNVRWEHNKLWLRPNEGIDYIPKINEPRLYVDSFNTLYFFEVTANQAGNYTCFVDGVRMQEVKIIVLTRSLFFTKEFTRHLKYLGFVFLVCFFGYLGGVIVMCAKVSTDVNKRSFRKLMDVEGEASRKLLKKKEKKSKQKEGETDNDSEYSS